MSESVGCYWILQVFILHYFFFTCALITTPTWVICKQSHKDDNVTRHLRTEWFRTPMQLSDLIHFSLHSKITHPLPTQPGCEQRCERDRQQSHPFPTSAVKKKKNPQRPAAVIHSTRHVANTPLPPLLETLRRPPWQSFSLRWTADESRGDKHAAFGCTCAPVTACLIFSFSFTAVAPSWRCDWFHT